MNLLFPLLARGRDRLETILVTDEQLVTTAFPLLARGRDRLETSQPLIA